MVGDEEYEDVKATWDDDEVKVLEVLSRGSNILHWRLLNLVRRGLLENIELLALRIIGILIRGS